jgi:hypothetical protein
MINGWGLGSSEERAGVEVMIVRGGEMVYASDGIFLISRIQHIHPQEIRSEQTLPLKIVA